MVPANPDPVDKWRVDITAAILAQRTISGEQGSRSSRLKWALTLRIACHDGLQNRYLGARTEYLRTTGMLLAGSSGRESLEIEGRTSPVPMVRSMRVGPRFFETLGIPILAGRNVLPEDFQNPNVAWVNQALARAYFPGGSAVHQHIRRGYVEIVGIVGNTKFVSLREEIEPAVFIPTSSPGSFILRTASNPMSLENAVRKTFSEVAPGLRISRVSSLSEQIDERLFNERMLARLSTVFASLALLVAAIEVYGVVAYSVTRRTSEIAIRVSLGAMPRDVVRLIAAEGLLPAAVGAAAVLCWEG